MSKLSIPELILSINNDLVYLSNIDTYEVIYINKALSDALGNPHESIWKTTPCYKLFHELDAPCDFCTNPVLRTDITYTWTHHDKRGDTWFTLNDKKIEHDGKNLRLEIARNVNDIMKSKAALADLVEEERILVDCVSLLHSQTSPEVAIHKLLEAIAHFHEAERAFVFEIDHIQQTATNTFEYCSTGVTPQIYDLQNLDLSYFTLLLDALKGSNCLYIKDIDKDINISKYPKTYNILKENNIQSIIITPVMSSDGLITGLLGVDNPKTRTYAESLLTPISYFIAELQEKQLLINELQTRSNIDELTNLKNLNSYRKDLINLENNLPKTCGILYLDIIEIKKVYDFHGDNLGDAVIHKLANFLRDIYLDHAYRISDDKFIVILPNCNREEFNKSILQLQAKVEKADLLKVCLGSTWQDNFEVSLRDNMKIAEQNLHKNMSEYYSKLGYDRRRRE